MRAATPTSWLKPLCREGGNLHDPLNRPEILGTHTGPFTPLNVVNPEPSYNYYQGRPDQVTRLVLLGWEVVDPQKGHRERLPEVPRVQTPFGQNAGTNLEGGLRATHELILLRMHKDRAAELAAEKVRRDRVRLEGAGQEFLSRNDEIARSAGHAAGRDPLYYAERKHGIEEGRTGSGERR